MSFIGKTLGKIVGHPSKSSSNSQSSSSSQPQAQQSSSLAQNNQEGYSNVTSSSTSSSAFSRSHHLSHDAQLTLTHLRKVFYEYLHPKHHDLSLAEKDEKLYSILPLFIKVSFILKIIELIRINYLGGTIKYQGKNRKIKKYEIKGHSGHKVPFLIE
jgi:hypothetical protein